MDTEQQRKEKLMKFLETNRKALEIVKNHKGKTFEEIQQSLNLNIAAHVSSMNHVSLFVNNILNQKGDLKTLADSAAKRIVLSDARIEFIFKKLTVQQKITQAERISQMITATLIEYFENLKGKKINPGQISNELTIEINKKIANLLSQI